MARTNGGLIGKRNITSFGKCKVTSFTSSGNLCTQSTTRVVQSLIVAGGGGTYTVDGGEGFDMYLASPATLEKVYDIAGEVIKENGVIVELTASKVYYLNDGTDDDIENVEYFMGTTGDDIFVGAERYESLYNIQAFNASGGSDQIFGAETAFAGTDQEINIKTAVDYSSMQGGHGAVFILDGSTVMSGADADGNLSYSEVQKAAGTKCPRCWKILEKECSRCKAVSLDKS